jgi:hypothetical protein
LFCSIYSIERRGRQPDRNARNDDGQINLKLK